jgi:uncharacterized protein YndB with AHSA1/START domain
MEKKKLIGQTKSSGFQIGIRKTYEISIEKVWDFLFSERGINIWLGEIKSEGFELDKPYKTEDDIEGEIKILKPYSHIRLTWKPNEWTNISALQIRVIDLKGKTTISIHQDKLLDSEQRDEMKTHWITILEKIKEKLIR